MPQSYSNVLVHVVFATSGRLPLIPVEKASDLYGYMTGVVVKQDCAMIAAGGMPNHVHLLIRLGRSISTGDLVGKIKGSSARWINKNWELPQRFSWQSGYAIFSVSESQSERVIEYIRNQARHHKGREYEAEIAELLRLNNLEQGDGDDDDSDTET